MITFLITLLVIIPVAFLFFNLGRARGRDEERAKKPKMPKAVCPCDHTWGEHKNGGSCLGTAKRPAYNIIGGRAGYEYVRCACTRYHGPIPILDEYFHPGFTVLPGPKE